MVEKIYDTIRGIIFTDFPKNTEGRPVVYDRVISHWIFGDQEILQAPLGVILRGTNSSIRDIGYGLREIEYTIGVTFYSSNDDKDTSERVIQEAARIAQNILKKHRSMWVCDLCPICNKLPLSPIHYIDTGVITDVGITTATIPSGSSSYKVYVNGYGLGNTGTAVIKLSPGLSGKVTNAEILSCGLGITQTSYSDSYASLTFTLSDGSGHSSLATTVINDYLTNVINQTNSYWAETHTTSSPSYYDWAGMGQLTINQIIDDWAGGFPPAQLTYNSNWYANFNSVVNNEVTLVRMLQDIQVSDVKPSDDGMGKAFLHSAEFTLRGKEIISVDQFGPNNVNVNAV